MDCTTDHTGWCLCLTHWSAQGEVQLVTTRCCNSDLSMQDECQAALQSTLAGACVLSFAVMRMQTGKRCTPQDSEEFWQIHTANTAAGMIGVVTKVHKSPTTRASLGSKRSFEESKHMHWHTTRADAPSQDRTSASVHLYILQDNMLLMVLCRCHPCTSQVTAAKDQWPSAKLTCGMG